MWCNYLIMTLLFTSQGNAALWPFNPPLLGVPSAPRNVVSVINQTSVLLEWHSPRDTGHRDDLSYNVLCRRCHSAERRACQPCDDSVKFVPGKRGIKETRVEISKLRAHTSYTFIVQVCPVKRDFFFLNFDWLDAPDKDTVANIFVITATFTQFFGGILWCDKYCYTSQLLQLWSLFSSVYHIYVGIVNQGEGFNQQPVLDDAFSKYTNEKSNKGSIIHFLIYLLAQL